MQKCTGRFPAIGITMGDPDGIGPEIILKSLKKPSIGKSAIFLIIGDRKVFDLQNKKLNINLQIKNNINFFHIGHSILAGKLQALCIDKAINLVERKIINAIVTAPVNKSTINKSKIRFSGHTEYIANRTKSINPVMMFVSKYFKLSLITTHMPIKSVSRYVTIPRIYNNIKTTYLYTRKFFGIKNPKIAVCGLNPHAGERGILGKEEIDIIEPTLSKLSNEIQGIRLYGPLPADTVFNMAYKGEFDVVVAMFHDQGLCPMKMVDFSHCVNITLGLPFIRTSPSHGTAQEIAGKGIADSTSMSEAIKLAIKLCKKGTCKL